MEVGQFNTIELSKFEIQEISGGKIDSFNPFTFVRDYIIGLVVDWYVDGVKAGMDKPATWDPYDPSNKMMNR
jgi:hypothetical protein